MIVQLTNKRNIILNWKVSANLNYGFLYSITIIITVSIVVLQLGLYVVLLIVYLPRAIIWLIYGTCG
jgi:hypothetical protein